MELHQFDGLLNHELVHFLCQNNKYYKYKNNINIEFSKKLNNLIIGYSFLTFKPAKPAVASCATVPVREGTQ